MRCAKSWEVTMPEFEDDLRSRLRDDAERVRPDVEAAWSGVARRLAAVAPAGRRAPGWQRQWWAAPAAAVLLAVLAAAVLLPGDDDTTTVAVGPPEAAEDTGGAPGAAAETRREAAEPTLIPPEVRSLPALPQPPGPLDGADDRGGYVGPFEGIYPAVTWQDYDRLRDEVADGRSTWITDPEEVARRYLRERAGAEPDGQVRPLGELVVEYEWSGGRVVLWRYGPPGSPWVVTGSDARGVEVGIGDYRREELYVGVRLERAGTVTIKAGAFDSEWLATHQEEVAAGGSAEATLDVSLGGAPGPEELLVDIRVDFADGSTASAQYRANAVTSPPGE
jgi:hypothetical protein